MYPVLELPERAGKGLKSDTLEYRREQRESSKIDLDRPGRACLDTIF